METFFCFTNLFLSHKWLYLFQTNIVKFLGVSFSVPDIEGRTASVENLLNDEYSDVPLTSSAPNYVSKSPSISW